MEYDYLEKQQQTLLYRRTQLVQRFRSIFPRNDRSDGGHKYEWRFEKPFTRYFHRNFSSSGYGVSLIFLSLIFKIQIQFPDDQSQF